MVSSKGKVKGGGVVGRGGLSQNIFLLRICEVYLYSKGFSTLKFKNTIDYERVFEEGLWFWDRVRLFATSWFPDLNPSTMSITKILNWVWLLNLSLHFLASKSSSRYLKFFVLVHQNRSRLD
jgi:hypothetical protein